MNFCSNCGQKLDGSNFCANCGMEVKYDEHLSCSVPPTPVEISTYYPSPISPLGNSQVFLANLFVEKDEQHISTFGNEQYIQFLNKGKAKKAFVILSDKRLYIRGKRYEINGKGSSNPDERGKEVRTEKVVDMKDVKTAEMGRVGRVTSFLYMYSALIVTVMSIATFVTVMLMSADLESEPDLATALSVFTFVTLGLSAIAVLLWVSFASSIKSCISLLYNDTWIRFPLEKYVGREGYALMRHIMIMQIPYREKVSAPNSNYNDSICTKDGQLIVKSKKIKPKERTAEKSLSLNKITDMEVLRRSRSVSTIIVVGLLVIFSGLCIISNNPVFLFIDLSIALIYFAMPSKLLRLKVTCNNTWFTIPIRSKGEGADIMRYIVEQQAHIEQRINVEPLAEYADCKANCTDIDTKVHEVANETVINIEDEH